MFVSKKSQSLQCLFIAITIIPFDNIKLLSPSGVTKQNARPIGPWQGLKNEKSTLLEVVQIYLNEEFEGGETEFLYFNQRIKPKLGRLIIFPCAFTHTHRGNPPIGGTKYIASTWGLMQSRSGTNRNGY